jgi:N-acetylglucosamine-6-sulfatase
VRTRRSGRADRSIPVAAATAVLVTLAIVAVPLSEPVLAARSGPNIVFIVTDDQRWDTLWSMPIVQDDLVRRGVTFANGFVTNPLCCPSRATIFTGQYSHSTGVYTNKERSPYGGFGAFDDRSTIATWLQGAGYRTGLFGKYINGYPGRYVPPGWDDWFATYDHEGYYDYQATEDGFETTYGDRPDDYGTTVIGEKAAQFIRDTPASRPVFAYVAPHGPHSPATPGPGDETAFSDLAPWRPAAYNESDVSDKPGYIQATSSFDRRDEAAIDRFRIDQYRTLLSIDRMVGTVIDALADTGRLSTTLIVFTSDNGIAWGEHRWDRKAVPYEEAIRVPFVVRYDPLVSRARTDDHLAVNIDMAPTAAAAAGVGAPRADGESLLPLLANPNQQWRSAFLLEHLGGRDAGGPTYCGVRTEDAVYVYYATGEEELYDLRRDPNELSNVLATGGAGHTLRSLRTLLGELCSPAPPGLTLPGWAHAH